MTTVGLTFQDVELLPCCSNSRTEGTGNCGFNNMCRNSMAVCKVKCNITGKSSWETHNKGSNKE